MANDFPPPVPPEWVRWALDHAITVVVALLSWAAWVEFRLRMLRQIPARLDGIEKEQADSAIERAEMRVLLKEIRDRTVRMDDTLHQVIWRQPPQERP